MQPAAAYCLKSQRQLQRSWSLESLTTADIYRASGMRGYVDLQVNGYEGIDFNAADLTIDEVETAAAAMQRDEVAAALPTVITASPAHMLHCISVLRKSIEELPNVSQVFRGIHIEGPFLSHVDGYIGAHPKEHASPQNEALLARLLDAAGPWAKLLTLAPEIDTAGRMTRLCRERKIVVAAGHSDASIKDLEDCVEQGLSLFTHLGNGCPRLMDRHDNIIYRALRFKDLINYSLIADGFHVPEVLFRNLLDWVPREHLLVVSDAISAAGLGPGEYQLGSRMVKIGEDRACRDASGEHFVGSASTMANAESWLLDVIGLDQATRNMLLVENPAAFLVES
ncbi:MAG: N-acetylglucosamine-6-phosphate deacetylase [Planctomycetota bacterium]